MVFPAKAWFRNTPWETLIKTVLRLERSVWKRDAKTGRLHHSCETVFWVASLSGPTAEQWNDHIRHTFAEDASRIRKNPDIAARLRSFAYNLLRITGCDNIKNARWRAALDLNLILAMPGLA